MFVVKIMPKSKKKTRKDPSSGSTAQVLQAAVKPSKKRLRIQSSEEDDTPSSHLPDSPAKSPGAAASLLPSSRPGSSFGRKGKKDEKGEKSKQDIEVRKIKQKLFRNNLEKKKLEEKLTAKRNQLKTETEKVNASEVKVAKLKKDLAKLKKSNEKVMKEKVEAAKEALEENNKLRKKIEAQKQKAANLELEKAKLESKLSSLNICDDPEAGPSSASGSSSGGLFQDMMDNFRELAETQLQCAVCSELFVEATSINCGHTFCHFCIHEWKKKKSNCPVCRTDIKQIVQCKVLDEYTDKVYEQFVSEGGKLARASLKEERNKIKQEAEAAANQRAEARRVRAERRNEENLEMVDIVLQEIDRVRRDLDEEESLDSDATLELHLSDGDINTDTDSEVDLHTVRHSFRSMFQEDSDTDSDDEDFRAGDTAGDTDSLSGKSLRLPPGFIIDEFFFEDSTESDTSQSSSDSSSDTDYD